MSLMVQPTLDIEIHSDIEITVSYFSSLIEIINLDIEIPFKVDKSDQDPDLSFETDRSIYPEVFLGKDVLKICNKFTGEYPC